MNEIRERIAEITLKRCIAWSKLFQGAQESDGVSLESPISPPNSNKKASAELNDCPSRIKMTSFKLIAKNKLIDTLSVEEFEGLCKRFLEYKDKVVFFKCRKFLSWLNLNLQAPKDHVDPETFLLPLPQPYQLISETVDTLYDHAWESILALHRVEDTSLEELQNNFAKTSTGDTEETGQSLKLYKCENSLTFHLDGAFTCVGQSLDGRIFAIGTNLGDVSVLNAPKGTAFAQTRAYDVSHALRQQRLGVTCISNIAHPFEFSKVNTNTGAITDTDKALSFVPYLFATAGPAEFLYTDPETHEESKCNGTTVKLFEFWKSSSTLVHVASMNCVENVCGINVSSDFKFMTVSFHNGDMQLIALPSEMKYEKHTEHNILYTKVSEGFLTDYINTGSAKALEDVKENDEETLKVKDITNREIIMLQNDLMSVQASKYDVSSKTGSNQESVCHFAYSTITKRSSHPMEVFQLRYKYGDSCSTKNIHRATKLLVRWKGSNRIRWYALPNEGNDGGGKEDAKDETVADADENKTESSSPPARILIREEMYPAPITSSLLDQSSSLLLIGLADGSVMVIDVFTGQQRASFVRHAGKNGSGSEIVDLGIYEQRYVVSGARDGSLHIHDLLRSPAEDLRGLLDKYSQYCRFVRIGDESPGQGHLHKLIASRRDSIEIKSISVYRNIPIAI
eukprot:g2595.t1